MALFWRLVLAHFAADFALQTDDVFRVKKRFPWGVLLHGAIFALTSVLATIPYLRFLPLWGGLVFLWLFHVAVDKTKLVLSTSAHRDHLGYFLLDQLLHLGAIGLISALLSRHPGMALAAQRSADLIPALKLGVAYIIAIWVSPLLVLYIRSAWLRWQRGRPSATETGASRPAGEPSALSPGLWRWMGYAERGCLAAVIAQGGRLFLLIPLILLPRTGLWISGGRGRSALWELILGSAVALAMGLWASTF